MEKVVLKRVGHDYWGHTHHVVDWKQMNRIIDQLIEKGVVVRYPTGFDFMMAVDLNVDSDNPIEVHIWSYQDTTGLQNTFDVDNFKRACRLGGVDVEIEEIK